MTQNWKPLLEQIDQIKNKLPDPKEVRSALQAKMPLTYQMGDTLITNLKIRGAQLEQKAREVAVNSKDSSFVLNIIKPLVESKKTEQALKTIRAKVVQSEPLIAKLEDYRQKFLTSLGEIKKTDSKKRKLKKASPVDEGSEN